MSKDKEEKHQMKQRPDGLYQLDNEKLLDVVNLLYETFETNNIPVSIGTNACVNLAVHILKTNGLSEEGVYNLVKAFEAALKSMGGSAVIVGAHEEQS